jgi:hypothetical protein
MSRSRLISSSSSSSSSLYLTTFVCLNTHLNFLNIRYISTALGINIIPLAPTLTPILPLCTTSSNNRAEMRSCRGGGEKLYFYFAPGKPENALWCADFHAGTNIFIKINIRRRDGLNITNYTYWMLLNTQRVQRSNT